MGKGKKNARAAQDAASDDENQKSTKVSRKEANMTKYSNITGEAREYIIRVLNRVEKAPRVRTTFEGIITAAKTKRDEMGWKDSQLDSLITTLEDFIDTKDTRKAADFNNYDVKFLDLLSL